jgi:galactokinase/mevalonate kinase-like predicted kinase
MLLSSLRQQKMSIRHFLSLPPAMSAAFARVSHHSGDDWFAACDPAGSKLGSGGGIVQILFDGWTADGRPGHFESWIGSGQKLVLLAGGQSRRLPAYAAVGKIFIPMPALRWTLGQSIEDTLLDFMLPGFHRIMESAGEDYPLLVCSGDVVLRFDEQLPVIPEADLVGLGMWVSPEMASHFGVFFTPRVGAQAMGFFKQKPSPDAIRSHAADYLAMVDTGAWLLGKRAISALLDKCGWDRVQQRFMTTHPATYELYSEFGLSLGSHPEVQDSVISPLRAAAVALPRAEFYHLGTTRQMIESISALQDCQLDQSLTGPIDSKPHPDIYVMNSDFGFQTRSAGNANLWVENSALSPDQTLAQRQVITGVPDVGLTLNLRPGVCLDITPIEEELFCIRVYGFDDSFKGALAGGETRWMDSPARSWFEARRLAFESCGLDENSDIQLSAIFPVVAREDLTSEFIEWLQTDQPERHVEFEERFRTGRRLSAMQICEQANIERIYSQRREMLRRVLPKMHANSRRNPFFRLDLTSVEPYFDEIPAYDAGTQSHDPILAANALQLEARASFRLNPDNAPIAEAKAFSTLRDAIIENIQPDLRAPHRTTLPDQIVWGRSPVRLDLAGGWTDTPPYCFKVGSSVVNMAVDINGQPPIQVFYRVCDEPHIVLKSIDLGVESKILTYDELADYARPGSGFALARAAMCLAGFHPDFQTEKRHDSLRSQLLEFGGGVEISLLAAAPKGSGLGTSSILAGTLLGTLSDACGLGWDHATLVRLTLAMEQMITTGGGWQDQVGGLYRGIKCAESSPGLDQKISLRWVPEHLFERSDSLRVARLYYTGITRMAVGILREIVRGMFLNSRRHLDTLEAIGYNASTTFETLLRNDLPGLGKCVARSWELNCRLDRDTNPPAVQEIIHQISDFTAGAKLLGAGGGGYLLILAKDEDAANRLERQLKTNPPNAGARFVDFSISQIGLQITRS